MDPEYTEISTSPYSESKLAGSYLGPQEQSDPSPYTKGRGYYVNFSGDNYTIASIEETVGSLSGQNKFRLYSPQVGKALLTSNLLLDEQEHLHFFKRQEGEDRRSVDNGSTKVVRFSSRGRSSRVNSCFTTSSTDDRCFQDRIWYSFREQNSPGRVVSKGTRKTHQLARVESGGLGLSAVGERLEGCKHKGSDRQHHGNKLHPETGQSQISSSSRSNALSLVHLCGLPHSDFSRAFARNFEFQSGSSVPEESDSHRVETEQPVLQVGSQEIWSSAHRYVCNRRQSPTSSLCHSISKQRLSRPQYFVRRLEQVEAEVHFPSSKAHSPSASLVSNTRNISSVDCSLLGKSRVVSSTIEDISDPDSITPVSTQSGSARKECPSQEPQILGTSRLEYISSSLRSTCKSSSLRKFIANRSGVSTTKSYDKIWHRFGNFINNSKFKNKPITIEVVLSYLFSLFKQGLALATMATHRAALSDPLLYGHNIDTNAKIFRDFFISCRTRRPIRKVLPPAWDVDTVLKYLKTPQFSNNKVISISSLFLKTLFLVALAAGSRISELSALRRDQDHLEFLKGNKGVNLSTSEGFIFKSERLLKRNPILFIPSLKNNKGTSHSLCPVSALKCWVDRTSDWDNPQNFLWINTVSRKVANARILALRFRQLVQLAYTKEMPANFHQIRKLATSIAFDKGLNLSQLCSRANWARESVFFKNYFVKSKSKVKCIVLGKTINK